MTTLRSVVVPLCIAAASTIPVQAGQVRIEMNQQINSEVAVPGAPGRQRTGTGRIRGRVLSSDSGAPVRRAQVRISGDGANRMTTTDGTGRYEFTELPDGRFTVMAFKAGYVTVQYGQTRPFEAGKPIELAEAQALDKVDIVMPRGSAIAGRIVDEFGEPVADATVTVLRQQWAGGRRRMVNAGRPAQTDDLGQYRIYGLPPGDYFVSATYRSPEALSMDMMMPGAAQPAAARPVAGYAPTYYPGTGSTAEAQKVTIAVGQESQGTDFALIPTRLSRITGVVLSSEGRPLEGAMISAVPSRGGDFVPLSSAGRTSREGAFTLSNIPPGDYVLQVRSMTTSTTSGGGDRVVFMTRIGGPDGESEFGMLPVSVSGEEVLNVVITTTKGGTASGHVAYEGGVQAPAANIRMTAIGGDVDSPMLSGSMGASVNADGTFEIKGLAGMRVLRASGLPSGWTLKTVELNGADVTDSGIDFKGGESVSGITVVLSPAATEIAGTVTTGNGSPARDYTVVVFADDPDKWKVPATRWISATRPDQDGRYRVRNMPAGSYYAIAVEYIPQGEWNDPDVLERLKLRAVRFTLGDGERRSQDLRVTEGG
jgi:hypothetical protein